MGVRKWWVGALWSRLMLGLPGAALAQDADAGADAGVVEPAVEPAPEAPLGEPAEDGSQLASVVVTADRRETNLQNTPIAITAFGPNTLQDRGVNSVRDLAGQVPNLSIARASISYTTQTYSLRGVGESDPIQEPVLAVYIDDVYQPRQLGSGVDFNDLERIEVLRGPQGTLYGRNSSAGALRVITSTPGDRTRVNAQLSYGTLNAVRAAATVSGALIPSKLYASISFLHNRRDGFTWNPTQTRDMNRINLDAARIKLRWTPTKKWDVLATFTGLLDRSDSRSYVPLNQQGRKFSSRISLSEVPPHQNLNQGSSALRTTYKPTDELEIKLISATGGFNLEPVWYDNDGEAALIQKNLIHYRDQYTTQELQFNGNYRWVDFTSGLFYLFERFYVQRDGYSRRNAMNTDPLVTPGNYGFARAHNVTKTHSFAVFGEVHIKPTKWLTLTGGLRETVEWKQFDFDNKGLNLQGEVVADSIDGDANHTWTALTPKGAISAQWTDNILQYVSVSRGFKSGGYDNRATQLMFAERAFNPEYVNSYETGLKTELFRRHLRANLAGFYNDYKDLQVSYTDPMFPGVSIRGNAGKAHTWGIELETDARLPGGIGLQFAGGFLDAVYDRYKNANGVGVNADNHRLINAPKWNFTAGGSYEIPLPVPGFVRLATDVQWASDYYSNALNRPEDLNQAQAFWNGTLTWTSPDEHTNVILSARNLLDTQRAVTSTYTPNTGVRYFNFPDPRTFLVTLRYQL
jgi:iron complex outermembrane receptor protein